MIFGVLLTKMVDLAYINQERIIHESEDRFGKIVVKEYAQIRSLYFDDEKTQSSIFIPHPSVLVLHYTQVMMSALLFKPEPKRVLLLGLGGGGIIHFLLKAFPLVHIDIVELRDDVIEVSHNYFELPIDSSRLSIYCCDAKQYVKERLTKSNEKYDMIFIDIFDKHGPSELNADSNFLSSCKALLSETGVITSNLWNRKTDHYALLFRKYRKVFADNIIDLKLGYLNSNVIVFAFSPSYKLGKMCCYRDEATKLKQKYGIDIPFFMDLIQKQNFSLMSRVKKFVRLA